jgi:hypothetical protein
LCAQADLAAWLAADLPADLVVAADLGADLSADLLAGDLPPPPDHHVCPRTGVLYLHADPLVDLDPFPALALVVAVTAAPVAAAVALHDVVAVLVLAQMSAVM